MTGKPLDASGCLESSMGKKGEIDCFKSRLVAKGFAQKPGIDYDETFSPVVRFATIRTLLAHAVKNDMLIHQMDVVTAFLNGTLDEDIYMQQPEGYVEEGNEHLVCKLKKSLYGLKQSPRCWNKTFKDFMESIGFISCEADPCVFIRGSTIVAVYVDDLILITNEEKEMDSVKKSLANRFKMKDMGDIHYLLGVSIEHSAEGLKLNQEQYIQKMLSKFEMAECNPVATPADCNVKLEKHDGISNSVDATKYQSMVGSLLYAAVATRPDIAHAVGVVSKFCAEPSEMHITAVKRIFRYLKGTMCVSLNYNRKSKSESVFGYCDADWAGDLDDRHSTSGYVLLLAGGAIAWLSKKQATVALSTAEAEYIALSNIAQEIAWLKNLLGEIGVDSSDPILVNEDNQSAIAMTKNVRHSRAKHIDIKFHFVKEAIENNILKLKYCPSKENVADILTKSLPKFQFQECVSALGIM